MEKKEKLKTLITDFHAEMKKEGFKFFVVAVNDDYTVSSYDIDEKDLFVGLASLIKQHPEMKHPFKDAVAVQELLDE